MSVARALVIAAFAGCFLAVAVLEALARRPGSRLPTLGHLCGFVLAYRLGPLPVGRLALLGFWWWTGWHFLAR
jgi:hypothetical protein